MYVHNVTFSVLHKVWSWIEHYNL